MLDVATQTGRLDFISAILAVLTLILPLAGLYAFFDLRRLARQRAREVATAIAEEIAERVANDYLQREFQQILSIYGEVARDGANTAVADRISEVEDDEA